MADYKAAYEREKQARKQAEQLLEDRSREVYIANERLTEQFKQLKSEFQQKSLLLIISRYSQEFQKLSELLPDIIKTMLSMAKIPFGVFDNFSLNGLRENYRSPVYVNSSLPSTEDLAESLLKKNIYNALDRVSSDVFNQHDAIYIRDLKEQMNDEILLYLKHFDIDGLLVIPIVAKSHTAAIVYLFVAVDELDKENVLALFESSIKQLGILIEHRFHEEELKRNYYELKATVDELNLTQKQLVQSEKMASIGQLSAGIAHEINNPMGYVKSNVNSLNEYQSVYTQALLLAKKLITSTMKQGVVDQYLLAELKELWVTQDIDFLLEDSPNLLIETKQGLERVVSIVSGLKSFSRASDQQWDSCNINQCLEEALKLAHNELKYKSTVSTDFLEIPRVHGNAGELIQVFLNLLINASQAIEHDGKIMVSTCEKNQGVEVSVIDNGKGIEDHQIQKIFDPFYTTKDIGEGTGLGLSISFGIVENHRGKIDVESTCGQNSGTRFTVWLPAMTS